MRMKILRPHYNTGFSTLEIVITFAILTISIVAVTMVTFGNQASAIDTELAQKGLSLAKFNLETAGAATLASFDSVISTTSTSSPFVEQITVSSISECAKEITSTAFWDRDQRIGLKSSLSSVFVSPKVSAALGGDCIAKKIGESWDNPTSFAFADLIQPNGNQATDIDVVDYPATNKVYALISAHFFNSPNSRTLWLVDVTNPNAPTVKGGFKDSDDNLAVDGYVDSITGYIYAYIASASSTAQLQIIRFDISDPNNPIATRVGKANLEVTESCPKLCPDDGSAIAYYDKRVYIGTHRIASGNEFQIWDVSNPTNPLRVGTKKINHNVNEIFINNSWAFLAASDDSGEIIAIDVSDTNVPMNIPNFDSTKFNAPGTNDGESLYVDGEYAYLGRKQDNNNPEFFIVRLSAIKNTSSITDGTVAALNLDNINCTIESGSIQQKSCLENQKIITGVVKSGDLAFLTTTNQNTSFQVWNVKNPANPIPNVGCNAYKFPNSPTGIDYANGYVYASIESQSALRIIYDKVGSCEP